MRTALTVLSLYASLYLVNGGGSTTLSIEPFIAGNYLDGVPSFRMSLVADFFSSILYFLYVFLPHKNGARNSSKTNCRALMDTPWREW